MTLKTDYRKALSKAGVATWKDFLLKSGGLVKKYYTINQAHFQKIRTDGFDEARGLDFQLRCVVCEWNGGNWGSHFRQKEPFKEHNHYVKLYQEECEKVLRGVNPDAQLSYVDERWCGSWGK